MNYRKALHRINLILAVFFLFVIANNAAAQTPQPGWDGIYQVAPAQDFGVQPGETIANDWYPVCEPNTTNMYPGFDPPIMGENWGNLIQGCSWALTHNLEEQWLSTPLEDTIGGSVFRLIFDAELLDEDGAFITISIMWEDGLGIQTANYEVPLVGGRNQFGLESYKFAARYGRISKVQLYVKNDFILDSRVNLDNIAIVANTLPTPTPTRTPSTTLTPSATFTPSPTKIIRECWTTPAVSDTCQDVAISRRTLWTSTHPDGWDAVGEGPPIGTSPWINQPPPNNYININLSPPLKIDSGTSFDVTNHSGQCNGRVFIVEPGATSGHLNWYTESAALSAGINTISRLLVTCWNQSGGRRGLVSNVDIMNAIQTNCTGGSPANTVCRDSTATPGPTFTPSATITATGTMNPIEATIAAIVTNANATADAQATANAEGADGTATAQAGDDGADATATRNYGNADGTATAQATAILGPGTSTPMPTATGSPTPGFGGGGPPPSPPVVYCDCAFDHYRDGAAELLWPFNHIATFIVEILCSLVEFYDMVDVFFGCWFTYAQNTTIWFVSDTGRVVLWVVEYFAVLGWNYSSGSVDGIYGAMLIGFAYSDNLAVRAAETIGKFAWQGWQYLRLGTSTISYGMRIVGGYMVAAFWMVAGFVAAYFGVIVSVVLGVLLGAGLFMLYFYPQFVEPFIAMLPDFVLDILYGAYLGLLIVGAYIIDAVILMLNSIWAGLFSLASLLYTVGSFLVGVAALVNIPSLISGLFVSIWTLIQMIGPLFDQLMAVLMWVWPLIMLINPLLGILYGLTALAWGFQGWIQAMIASIVDVLLWGFNNPLLLYNFMIGTIPLLFEIAMIQLASLFDWLAAWQAWLMPWLAANLPSPALMLAPLALLPALLAKIPPMLMGIFSLLWNFVQIAWLIMWAMWDGLMLAFSMPDGVIILPVCTAHPDPWCAFYAGIGALNEVTAETIFLPLFMIGMIVTTIYVIWRNFMELFSAL